MTDKKTIAIFGAGTGLGASLAARFGRSGYQIALIARRAAPLQARIAELEQIGVEASAFTADLSDPDAIPGLVNAIEQRLGAIDVAVYAPVPTDPGLIAAADLDVAGLRSAAQLFLYGPVAVSHAVLPGMIARGDGAIVVVGGLSAVTPIPGFGNLGTVMAAARSYARMLNAEVRERGVYAGSVSIGALIERSATKQALDAGGAELAGAFPTIDPDDIAQEIWHLIEQRDRAEVILPPLPAS